MTDSEFMIDRWLPPFKDSQGRYSFGDWRPIRSAIEAALKEIGEDSQISDRDWKLVALAMDFRRHSSRYNCLECGKHLDQGTEIRCLDCKGTLCEECAPKHFWPNGKELPLPPSKPEVER